MNRQIGRVALVVLGIVGSLLAGAPDLSRLFGHPLHPPGFTVEYDRRISGVGPEAQEAGIRVGDVFDIEKAPLEVRLVVLSAGVGGQASLDVPMLRNGHPYVAHVPLVAESADRLVMVAIRFVVQLLCIILATLIVLRRPSPAAWGFFALNLMLIEPVNVAFQIGPTWWRAAMFEYFCAFCQGSLYWGAAFFALYVLHDGVLPAWRRNVAALLWVFFATNVVSGLYLGWSQALGAGPPGWIEFLSQGLSAAAYYVAVALLFVTYFEYPPALRERLRWIIAGFAIAAFAGIGVMLSPFFLGILPIPYTWYSALLCLQFVPPAIAVSYAVLKHRIIDVNIAVTRATVYATLSVAIVGIFALVDLFFTRALAAKDAGWIADAGIALALGFSFNTLHRHVDTFIDSLLFRQRHLAEEHVASLTPALAFAADEQHVWHMLLDEPARAFGLSWARAITEADPESAVEPLATLAAVLKAGRHAKRIAMELWDVSAAIVVPVFCHNELFAVACYGPHKNGTDIDADEARLLEALASAAGNAFERLELESLRRENESLRALYNATSAPV